MCKFMIKSILHKVHTQPEYVNLYDVNNSIR